MKKLITISTFLFLSVMFLTGCADQSKDQNIIQEKIQKQEFNQEGEVIEKVSSEEMIDFDHPGNDEVGKKVEGVDSLINSTSTTGYDDDLSGEVLSELE